MRVELNSTSDFEYLIMFINIQLTIVVSLVFGWCYWVAAMTFKHYSSFVFVSPLL